MSDKLLACRKPRQTYKVYRTFAAKLTHYQLSGSDEFGSVEQLELTRRGARVVELAALEMLARFSALSLITYHSRIFCPFT
jgi:hypothetical protein